MPKLSFNNYLFWYRKVEQRLDELNALNEFTTLHWYELGFRGKKNRLCLIRDEFEVIACGMKQITSVIQFLRSGKRLFED